MKLEDSQLKELLLNQNYVTKEDIELAESYAKEHRTSLIDYLTGQGLITKDLLGQAIAEAFNVPYADLNSNAANREQVMRIPEEIATKYRLVLFEEKEGQVTVTTDNPQQPELTEVFPQLFPNVQVILAYSVSEDIDAAFIFYRKALETRFAQIVAESKRVAPELIFEIIEDAIAYRASDVHFEPQDKDLVIRFRIDGVLHEAGRFPKKFYENILNRIKVQAHLRIDEHFSAQDGSMRFEGRTKTVDLRISIVPTLGGEKIAIRILAHYVRGFSLADIGLSGDDQSQIEENAKKPFGMILVTGPTGSGKTTTLYALLRLLNRPEINITTIEDPVEYRVGGVNQIQVNLQTNLTFAKGLRSIVRQDPDIILVGEIRDEETAEIAVNAALTGHLLLSTFHANDAASAIPRLLDMRAEPFLLASTLNVIIAQRLVRKICEQCKYSVSISPTEIAAYGPIVSSFFSGKNVTLYKSKGCDACNGTGFSGRTGVFEIIVVSPEMQNLVLKGPSAQQVWQLAQSQGAQSLFENGVDKVKRGVTTLEELLRVVAPPSLVS
ncbi:MAG: ATPase, T2SS/T4P/T4SS family [bacterium]|nr:ATPase, T2SS/T4P/T4SS family [bacterium]